ncbi:MAG TPA: hypothetical protein PKM97_05475 [Bacteroidia bacterium]|nr:hypothetical protein [Bacteroidia bacterium]
MKVFKIALPGIFLTFLIFAAYSCKKDSDKGQIVYGTYSLDITVMHHSWNVPNIPVYLKKNATTFPGIDTALYEYKTIADSDGKARFEKLFPGNYYLFAQGYDYYFGADVIGSTPIVLTNPGLQDKGLNITLMVSE